MQVDLTKKYFLYLNFLPAGINMYDLLPHLWLKIRIDEFKDNISI